MKRFFVRLSAIFVVVMMAFNMVGPRIVHASGAFSIGDGSEDHPYQIANCEQLQAIQDDLDAYYELLVNIDCSEVEFSSIGDLSTPFSGSLEGRNKIIKNLTIDGFGLFGVISGGIVHDIKLDSPTVSGTTKVGALAGTAVGAATNISNIHVVDGSVTGSSNYIGGMVGDIGTGNPVLEKSSYRGTVSGPGVVGGFVGSASGAAYIQNNYVIATITVLPDDSPAVGGFFGLAGASQTAKNYAVTTIDAEDSGFLSTVGGFAAIGTGTVNYSFADMNYNSGADSVGDFLGTAAGLTINGNYYADHGHDCASNTSGGGGCFAVDTDSDPDYFKDSSNAPFSYEWDFENTWEEVEGDYPRLLAEATFNEGSEDINGDSIIDTYQANVIGVPDDESNLTVVELNSDSDCTLDPMGSWIDAGYYKADPYFPLQIPRMTAFTVYCPSPGAQVSVTLVYPEEYDTSDSVLRFYDDVADEYHTVSGVTFGTRSVNSTTVTTATYILVDGGENDTDGAVDGIIHDPVGIAVDNSPIAVNQSSSGNANANNTAGGNLATTGQSSTTLNTVAVILLTSSVIGMLALYFKRFRKTGK